MYHVSDSFLLPLYSLSCPVYAYPVSGGDINHKMKCDQINLKNLSEIHL